MPGVLGVPEHAQDLLRSANWLADAVRSVGLPVVDVQSTACRLPG
ncbi:hypothetical protein [Pseudarthrobacter sp. L1SW]|nr:hypothetical protein [Pseudarthrobacter sp. L1SW]